MRIRYSLRAFADREAIYDYLEKRSPQGARNVQLAIVQAIRGLALHPRLGRMTDKPGVYELIVPRRPYKVYYRIEARRSMDRPYPRRAAASMAGRRRLGSWRVHGANGSHVSAFSGAAGQD